MLSSAALYSTSPPATHHTRQDEQTKDSTTISSSISLDSVFHPDSPPSPLPKGRFTPRNSTSANKRRLGPQSTSAMAASASSPISRPKHPNVFFSTPSSKAKAQSASAQIRNETNFNTFRMTPPPPISTRRRQPQSTPAIPPPSGSLSQAFGTPSLSSAATESPTKEAHVQGERVLQTPRRGRRLGGIEMGWETPRNPEEETMASSSANLASTTSSLAAAAAVDTPSSAPRTRATGGTRGTQLSIPTSITPRKRRSPGESGPQADSASSSPTKRSNNDDGEVGPSLRDEEGYAMAAVYASSSTPRKSDYSLDGSPAYFEAPPTAPARFDRLAAFRTEVPPASSSPNNPFSQQNQSAGITRSSSNLVAVDVKGMGRVAVAREVAVQLGAMTEEELKVSQAEIGSPTRFFSTTDSVTEGFSSYSRASSSHVPTSLDTPGYSMTSGGYLGPSPSFSLASHFPVSEDGSPSLRARTLPRMQTGIDTATLERIVAFKNRLVAHSPAPLRRSSTSANIAPSGTHTLATTGSFPSSSSFPSLAWPDTHDGPWSVATTLRKEQDEVRLTVVSRWLDGGDNAQEGDDGWMADDETAQPHHRHGNCARGRSQCHPMVAKVMRDRSRKATALLASSASMPDLRGDPHKEVKRRGRKIKGSGKSRRTRPRHELQTPIKKHFYTPSSLSRSVLSSGGASGDSFIGCLCGSSQEDSPMVQCDGCQIWYHMRCAGIRRAEELEDTWFCQPCAADPSSSHTRRLLAISPASTIALADLHASGGSDATSTPGMLRSSSHLAAFPRTYASHIGVSTPSAAYPRVKHESLERLPVFSHDEIPAHHATGRLEVPLISSSGSLALAPSPDMDTGDGPTILKRQHARGRSRASRIGWRTAEPGSPLDRKSASALPAFAATTPSTSTRGLTSGGSSRRSYGVKQHTSNARGHGESEEDQLTSSRTMSPSFYSSLRGRGSSAQTRGLPGRTPSPSRALASATPSRHARSGRGDSDLDPDHPGPRDADDILSTPSRHWWTTKVGTVGLGASTPGNVSAPIGLQTPSRSTRRREPSGWALSLANFSTPGSAHDRDLLFGQQNGTDVSGGYSSGLPSLIYSSGSVIGGGAGLDPPSADEFSGAHWLNAGLGSPSRSLRRRQRSHLGNPTGNLATAMIGETTPSRSNIQAEISSMRTSTPQGSARRRRQPSFGSRGPMNDSSDGYDDHGHGPMDPPTSSSPYPRTPSVDLGFSSANRLTTRGSGGAPTPNSPTPSRGKMTLGAFAPGHHHSAQGNLRKSMSMNAAHGSSLALADAVSYTSSSHHKPSRRLANGDVNAALRARQASAQHFDPGAFGVGLGLDIDDVLQFY